MLDHGGSGVEFRLELAKTDLSAEAQFESALLTNQKPCEAAQDRAEEDDEHEFAALEETRGQQCR